MNKPRKVRGFGILILLGLIITVASVTVFGSTVIFRNTEQKNVEKAAKIIVERLPETENGIVESGTESIFPNMEIGSRDYCGLLSYNEQIWAVLAYQGQSVFEANPVKYSGNPKSGSLIIFDGGGKQLAFANTVEAGERITFTDVLGTVFNYTVTSVKHCGKNYEEVIYSYNSDIKLIVKSENGYLIVLADS